TNTPRDPMSAADDQICNRSDPKGFRRIGGAPVQAEIGEKGVCRSTRVHESGRNSDSVTPAWANDVRMDCKAASHSDGTSGTVPPIATRWVAGCGRRDILAELSRRPHPATPLELKVNELLRAEESEEHDPEHDRVVAGPAQRRG